MEVLVVGAVMALLIYFGQDAPSPSTAQETVVLLPGPDGHVGTVIVTRGEQRRILNQAYATTQAVGQREVAFEVRIPEAVRSEFGQALAALPVRPASFTVFFGSGVDELVFESKGELEQALDELTRRPRSDHPRERCPPSCTSSRAPFTDPRERSRRPRVARRPVLARPG